MKTTFTLNYAKTAAAIHLLQRLKEEGYMPNDTYVVVGVDNSKRLSVYAKPLPIPDVFFTNPKDAFDVFARCSNSSNEFLFHIEIDIQKFNTLSKPDQRIFLVMDWDKTSLN